MKNLVVVLAASAFLSSCYSVNVVAPPGQDVTLASKSDNLTFKESQRQWFVLFGLVPVNKNNTENIIKENNLTKVRVETKMTFLDVVISAFTSIASFVTTSTIVEGNAGSAQ